MRARLDVLDQILRLADRYAVDAVLCAGDLFDEPRPDHEWWETVSRACSREAPHARAPSSCCRATTTR